MSSATPKPFDPCLSCALPDCDEASPKCGLKRANAAYSKIKRQGRLDDAPRAVKDGHNAWYHAYKLEREARRSEQALQLSHQSEVSS